MNATAPALIPPGLRDVPETTLWTLHNRASEAARPDGCIRDPKCLEIYRALDYDYERRFGPAEASHGVRSQLFDERMRAFVAAHPDGVIVNLGEGLETHRFRVHAPRALWLSVDLPEAIALRERFIAPDAQHRHIAASAMDLAWMDAVPPGRAVFISAQGLLMYLREQDVAALLRAMATRFPGAWLMFDHLHPRLSARSLSAQGWMKTPHYRTPPMPWGVRRDALQPLISRWLGQPVAVQHVRFRFPRGPLRWLVPLLERTPFVNHLPGGVCWLRLPE
ncbi:class I SAM-dependent methyltransferase [Vandammella animalimorsus]|uniref:Methyltransferase n=1 Tax=Vandammella animalimorsus TaxID=2029117 RepID=A0A2A2AR84_9BURK|nr:class I SAM-dependent methyltransferase [Vandammella animalimorsus]PAT40149.1 methyltransferase [Vandammella animalimorsus]